MNFKLTAGRVLRATVLCGAIAASAAAGAGAQEGAGSAPAAPVAAVTPDSPIIIMNNGKSVALKQADAIFKYEIPDNNKAQFMTMPGWQQRFMDEVSNMATLAEAARAAGIDKSEDYKAMMGSKEMQVLATLYVQNVVGPELDKAKATKEEIQKFYDDNKESFFSGWRQVSQIVVKDKATADKLYKQVLAKPATFGDVAKKHSIDADTKASGGDLGKVSKGGDKVLPELEDTIFKTPKGKIAAPEQGRNGWVIVMVKDASTDDYAPLDDKIAAQIYTQLEGGKRNEAFEKIMADLKTGLGVKLDPAVVQQVGESWKKDSVKSAPQP